MQNTDLPQIIYNWPSMVVALVPVLIMIMQYLQSLTSQRIEKKVDENTAVTHETKVMVNSASQELMQLRIVDLQELIIAKPGDVSVIARLEAAQKLLADHKTKQAVLDDRSSHV